MASITLPPLLSIPATCAGAQAKLDLARVAIALERHRLRHGAYPESLAVLDPECRPNGIPSDAITGDPPHYALADSGAFTLSYEGWKEEDDGADAAWKNMARKRLIHQKRDWVWPQPAATNGGGKK
jgi:hypothetical protein